MTDRELMQQALDALNHVNVQDRVQIITALRERLTQPEQEPVATKQMLRWVEHLKRLSDDGQHMSIPGLSSGACWELAIELEQFIKNTAPTPRKCSGAWFDHGIGADRFKVVRGAFWWHVLIGDSPTEHGKFRSRAGAEKMAANLLREFRNGAFVQHGTAPPKREWVGLTDEELKPLCDENHIMFGAYTVDFIQAIEAKLKEKNHG